jgi:ribosomal protein S18 acetylase RimI-like enzyme
MITEKMRIDDYEETYQLWSETEGLTLRAIDDSREGIERFIKRNPNNSFICRIDGKIIGCILCGHDGRKGFIYHACIHKNQRGKGIGKKLVDHAINSLKEEQITKVAVLTNSDNKQGNDFWSSIGFGFSNDLDYRLLILDNLNI